MAKGFDQEPGVNFKETVSPVAKCYFEVLQMRELDVETVFLYK